MLLDLGLELIREMEGGEGFLVRLGVTLSQRRDPRLRWSACATTARASGQSEETLATFAISADAIATPIAAAEPPAGVGSSAAIRSRNCWSGRSR